MRVKSHAYTWGTNISGAVSILDSFFSSRFSNPFGVVEVTTVFLRALSFYSSPWAYPNLSHFQALTFLTQSFLYLSDLMFLLLALPSALPPSVSKPSQHLFLSPVLLRNPSFIA